MQREIRFRAWDKEDKSLVRDGFNMLLRIGESLQNERFIFTQYTGIKDKNGKEIYEGDILESGQFGVCKVAYFAPEFCGVDAKGVLRRIHSGYKWTIQGNVWENPELLSSNEKE